MSLSTHDTRNRAATGVFFVVGGMVMLTIQDGMMKALLGEYSLWLLMGSRGVMALAIYVPIILFVAGPHRLLSPIWHLHMLRGAVIGLAFSMFFSAFPFMQLAEVSTIFFASPLMIALMAVLFLREKIGPHRIFALILGFAGVLIALNPTSDAFQPVALLPFGCAVLYAVSQILARKMGDGDSVLTTGLYSVVFMAIFTAIVGAVISSILPETPETYHLRWDWTLPEGWGILWVAAIGASGMAGVTGLTRGYQVANASLLAPFDYTYLPMAATMAYWIWGEVPSRATLIGMALIIVAGVYLAYREMRAED